MIPIKCKNLAKKQGGVESMQKKVFYCIVGPYLAMNFIIKGLPFLWGIFISFTNYTGFNINDLQFVGFENYIRVFTDNDAFYSLGTSFKLCIISVPLNLMICLFMSLMLNRIERGKAVFRTICYIPSIIPAVAVSMIWLGLYNKSNGMINSVLAMCGIHAVDWLDYENITRSLIIMLSWSSCAGILTNLAAMHLISPELYEAADLEGASEFTKTFKITLPLISNIIYMNLLTSLIATLQIFGEPVLLSSVGGASLTSLPKRPVYTYLVHVYQQIFVNLRYGYGMAMTWIIFILIMTVTLLMEKGSKKWVYNEVEG